MQSSLCRIDGLLAVQLWFLLFEAVVVQYEIPIAQHSLDRACQPGMLISMGFDHPIFSQSLHLIEAALPIGSLQGLSVCERDVVLRLIHSSGDLSLVSGVSFSDQACELGLQALRSQVPILTDTAMAAAAVAPMARRTFGNLVCSVLDWAPEQAPKGGTRAAVGMQEALRSHPGAVVLIGSAPTALELLLEQVRSAQVVPPALVIGMPVGFVGVAESKNHLAASDLPQIRLDGSRGGAGLVAAVVNALLRRAWLDRARVESDRAET